MSENSAWRPNSMKACLENDRYLSVMVSNKEFFGKGLVLDNSAEPFTQWYGKSVIKELDYLKRKAANEKNAVEHN